LVSIAKWFKAQGTGGVAMNREPTVTQIVDRIMALECGESCDVRLDPHITRIGNLEWLLPICVRQFGTEIACRESPEADCVMLTITATATRRPKIHLPASQDRPVVAPPEKPLEVVDEPLATVA
jgi:hypothetical protein